MKKIAILGATSEIAQHAARIWAVRGDHLFLVARNPERLSQVSNDLMGRGAQSVDTYCADLAQVERHAPLLVAIQEKLGDQIDVALIAHGTLGDTTVADPTFADAENVLQTNLNGVVSLCLGLHSLQSKTPDKKVLAVISSIAGDRGRQGNFIYCASKAGLNAFLEGFRARHYKGPVQITTIKPGPVLSPMTVSLGKMPFQISAAQAGLEVVAAIDSRADTTYVPGIWYWIMKLIRWIPDPIFKRLKI